MEKKKSCFQRKASLHSRRQTSRKTVKVRFLADANFNRKIIAGVLRREARINFLSGAEVDLTGIPDLQVLALAASEGRVVLTHEVRSMGSAFAAFTSTAPSVVVLVVACNG